MEAMFRLLFQGVLWMLFLNDFRFNLCNLKFSWKSFIKILKCISISPNVTYFLIYCHIPFITSSCSFFPWWCLLTGSLFLFTFKDLAHRLTTFFCFQINDSDFYASRNVHHPLQGPSALCASSPSLNLGQGPRGWMLRAVRWPAEEAGEVGGPSAAQERAAFPSLPGPPGCGFGPRAPCRTVCRDCPTSLLCPAGAIGFPIFANKPPLRHRLRHSHQLRQNQCTSKNS